MENFKKHKKVGPAPAATKGDPADPKVTNAPGKQAMQPGHLQERHHPKQSSKHEPPVTAKARGARITNPTPSILKTHGETSAMHTMKKMGEHHTTVQGSRYPTSGGASLRPYTGMNDARMQSPTGQQHTPGKTPRVPHTVGMTKSVRGMIGRPKKYKKAKLY